MNLDSVLTKCITLDEGIEKVQDQKRQRRDLLVPFKHMGFTLSEDNAVVLEDIDGKEYSPTPYAWRQVCRWLNLPVNHVEKFTEPVCNATGKVVRNRDRIDSEILLNRLRNERRNVDPEKQFLFRTYNDGSLRAMLSDRYGIIDNTWYLEQLKTLFGEIGGDEPRLFHWRGDADTVYGNLILPDTFREDNDGSYGGMISMSNCEIGRRRWSQTPSIFRGICTNGCIFGQVSGEILRKKHLGDIDLVKLSVALTSNINEMMPLFDEGIEKFLAMRQRTFEQDISERNLFATLGREQNFTGGIRGQLASIVEEYVNHERSTDHGRTLFGVVNAITRAGQRLENDEWVRFDTVAGNLMRYSEPQFNAFKVRVRNADPKVVDKILGDKISAA